MLRETLEVGRWTGSAKNAQPWDIVVARKRAMLERLPRLGAFMGHLSGAKVALVLPLSEVVSWERYGVRMVLPRG